MYFINNPRSGIHISIPVVYTRPLNVGMLTNGINMTPAVSGVDGKYIAKYRVSFSLVDKVRAGLSVSSLKKTT